MSVEIAESCLKWFGYVRRRGERYLGKRFLEMGLPGWKKRGRPTTRWMDNIRKDLKAAGG